MSLPVQVLRTGQSTRHDVQGVRIDCTRSGQDAAHGRGRPQPRPRIELRGELVTDRLTGLMWPRDAGLGEFPLTWEEALDLVSSMNAEGLLGHRDRRLPNRRELRSLIDHQTRRPSLPEDHPFQRGRKVAVQFFCGVSMSVGLSRFPTPEPDTLDLKEKVPRPRSSGRLEVGRNGL